MLNSILDDYVCFWRECAPDLLKCVYVLRESFVIQLHLQNKRVYVFYESLQITFPHNVLVSKFHCLMRLNVTKVYSFSPPHGREGRGEQGSLAFKGTWTEKGRCEQSCFWLGKRVLF